VFPSETSRSMCHLIQVHTESETVSELFSARLIVLFYFLAFSVELGGPGNNL